MELAIGRDDFVVGSVGDRFLERGDCSRQFDQPLPGPALSGECRCALVSDGCRFPDGPADPRDAQPDEVRDQLKGPVAPVVQLSVAQNSAIARFSARVPP